MIKLKPGYAEPVLLFVAFVWGSNPPVIKWSLQYMDPMSFNAVRMLIACILSGILLLVAKPQRRLERVDWLTLVKLGAFGFFLFQLFLTVGVTRTTAGNASLVLGMLPVSVAVINAVSGLEPITRRIVLSIAITLAGVCLIVLGSGSELSLGGDHIAGAGLLLCAQCAYGYYTVFSRPLTAKYSSLQINACVFAVTTLLFVLVALPDLLANDWRQVAPAAWAGTVYSGIFPLTVGNALWVWGVGIIGSAKASLFNNLAPVFAILIAYLLLGEAFGPLQALGAAIIYAGLRLGRKQPQPAVPPEEGSVS
ncbi:MAG: DMT family transporter [Sporomusaceae bacterium]|nr:DMT family transporter [Sporomusaceae bacterium]